MSPGVADAYAAALLSTWQLPISPAPTQALPGRSGGDPHPDIDWARSGAMALTGFPGAPPLRAPGPLASCARGAVLALESLAGRRGVTLDGPALLGERAALLGLERRGTTSPGGSCRLLPALDGWIALNLARTEDAALMPAWLETKPLEDPWSDVERCVASLPVCHLVERGRLLGLPVAHAPRPPRHPPPWCRVSALGKPQQREPRTAPRVIDLSALWAGPLCSQLLERMGARVIKVECTRRPDGARNGNRRFFDLLNGRKDAVAFDFSEALGRRLLTRLLETADIVVESARPRALRQLGIHAERWVAARPGRTWLSITGYGRHGPGDTWVAFGDDAGVAAGLAIATGSPTAPLFCGDAIADPLTGLHAAVAGWASWRRGGGHLVDLALCDVVAHTLGSPGASRPARVRKSAEGWQVIAENEQQPVLPPRARPAIERARPLGADTLSVLRELGFPC